MTKRMLIMIGAVIVLIAALAGGKYLQIKKLIASIPKPQPVLCRRDRIQLAH